MRLYSVRHVRKVGAVGYFPIPKIVMHELGIVYGDQIEIELDTVKKHLIVRPLRNRVFVPQENQRTPDMLPFTLHADRIQRVDPPAADATDPEKLSA